MKKWSVVLCSIIVLLSSCSKSGRNYVVDVELKGLDKPVFAVHQMYNGKLKIDTLFANANFFRIKGNADSLALLRVTDVQGNRYFSLYVKNGDRLRVEGSIDNLPDIKISDSPLNSDLQKFRKDHRELLQKKIAVQNELIQITSEKENRLKQLNELSDSIQGEIENDVVGYIRNNRGSVSSAALIREYLLQEKSYAVSDSLYALLKPEAKTGIPVITAEIRDFLRLSSKGAVDTKAEFFFLQDQYNNTFSSTHYEGKTAVLFFWSPREGLSTSDMRTLRQLTEFFGDSTLAVVTIAFEADTSSWKSYLKMISVEGYHTIQPLEFASDLADQFGIHYLPTTVVVNKQGYVAARNIQGLALLDKVKSLLADKTPYRAPAKNGGKQDIMIEDFLKKQFNVSFLPKPFVRFEDGSVQLSDGRWNDDLLIPFHPDSVEKMLFIEKYIFRNKIK